MKAQLPPEGGQIEDTPLSSTQNHLDLSSSTLECEKNTIYSPSGPSLLS